MIKLLLSSALFVVVSASSNSTKVYICDSENAVAYHYTKNCRGIKPCTHDVLEVTVVKAKEKGLRLCGWED